jgi:hypothetical protein
MSGNITMWAIYKSSATLCQNSLNIYIWRAIIQKILKSVHDIFFEKKKTFIKNITKLHEIQTGLINALFNKSFKFIVHKENLINLMIKQEGHDGPQSLTQDSLLEKVAILQHRSNLIRWEWECYFCLQKHDLWNIWSSQQRILYLSIKQDLNVFS